MMRLPLVTVGGLGLLRPAPGTWGSLPPVLVAAAMLAADASTTAITLTMIVIALASSFICIALGPWSARRFGTPDPSSVVIDETAGQALAFIALPWPDGAWIDRAALLMIGFLAFRIFDITKIGGARRLQHLPAGFGILVDDLVAGVYAWIVTSVCASVIF